MCAYPPDTAGTESTWTIAGCNEMLSKRRLLYYNDSRHYYMYSYDPPMRLQDAWAPVDEVAGTAVDTFVYGSGAGTAMLHDTQVGEVWGRRLQRFDSAWAWRAYENVKSLIDHGLDPLNVLIDRAHDKGMEFFASLRVSHGMDPKDVGNVFNLQFKIDHPDWCLKGSGNHALNWIFPEVRAERFALAEEYVTRYDLDGLEIEWTFLPTFFEEGEVARNTHILTEFMGDVRRVVDVAASKRGRHIAFGARVLPTLSGNLAVGMDVPSWVEQGLVDFVVPNVYLDRQIDPDFPFEWLVDITRETECEVYPILQRGVRGLDIRDGRVASSLDVHASLEQYRAGAAAYWAKGADAIYVTFLRWPPGSEQRHILSEIHDPDQLKEKSKHYVIRRHHDESDKYGYSTPLKSTLTAGSRGQTAGFFVADEPDTAAARLRIRLTGSTSLDSLVVSFNGDVLPPAKCIRTDLDGYYGAWLEYPLVGGALLKGRNEVGVVLNSRPQYLTESIIWESAELLVGYSSPRASSPMP